MREINYNHECSSPFTWDVFAREAHEAKLKEYLSDVSNMLVEAELALPGPETTEEN